MNCPESKPGSKVVMSKCRPCQILGKKWGDFRLPAMTQKSRTKICMETAWTNSEFSNPGTYQVLPQWQFKQLYVYILLIAYVASDNLGRCQSAPRVLRYWTGMYGQLKEPPLSSMSLMRVSMGVLPTRRTKNSCSMTCADIVRSDGSLSSSLPKRVGCPGYCVLTYSSNAHCDFSWIDSTCVTSDIPHASVIHTSDVYCIYAFPVHTRQVWFVCGWQVKLCVPPCS